MKKYLHDIGIVPIFLLVIVVGVFLRQTMGYEVESAKKEGEKTANISLTTQDGLFLHECIVKGEFCNVREFYGDIITPFAKMIIAKQQTKSSGKNPTTTLGIFYSKCTFCHDHGIMGAPHKLPNKPIDSLYDHAINGFSGKLGQMPPKGNCQTCTEEDIKKVVLWWATSKKEFSTN